MDDLKDAIKQLLKESEKYSNTAASGYDEGWYNGEKNAYEKVLDIIEKSRDNTINKENKTSQDNEKDDNDFERD